MKQSVEEWLRKLGLPEYIESFTANRIDYAVLSDLSDQDLKDMGVVLGDRRRMLRAIAEMGRAAEAEASPPDTAERRQLTMMFCDLVGSTALAERLDLEDMRGVVEAYQRCCAAAITSQGGFVAKYMGDGVLAYFGYPRADEHDAERAVRAGLAITEATPNLRTAAGSPLHVRIGLATGIVVVGDIVGLGEARERMVVGETPNLAARLQTIADPDTVVVSDGTRRLLGRLFEFRELGLRELKGIATPVRAWQALRSLTVESRFEALHDGGDLSPLLGRDRELATMRELWRRARAGEGQTLDVSGQPGVGKSRLMRAFLDGLYDDDFTAVSYHCSPDHTNSALYPIVQKLQRAAKLSAEEPAKAKLDKLRLLAREVGRPDALPVLAHLLSIEGEPAAGKLVEDPLERKNLVLDELVAWLVAMSEQHPVLIVAEDLHWVDPTSLEFLARLHSRIGGARIMLNVTHRPEFSVDWPSERVAALALNGLSADQSSDLLQQLTMEKPLPQEITSQIVARADGVPLFIEELTKSVVESGLLIDRGDHFEIGQIDATAAIPATLRDSLLARLDRLESIREVAQVGAAIGREFSYELILSVLQLPPREVRNALQKLTEAGLLFARRTTPASIYVFKHALIRDTAYDSLLRSRRTVLHGRIAEVLVRQHPDIANSQPELVAHHYTLAGDAEQAVKHWWMAGRRATERSGSLEAISHFEKALEVLRTQPETPERARGELRLLVALLTPSISTKGYNSQSTQKVIAAVKAVAEETGDTTPLFPVLYGEWAVNIVGGKVVNALLLAQQFDKRAQIQAETVPHLVARRMLGTTYISMAQLSAAEAQFAEALAIYHPEQHASAAYLYGQDSRVSVQTFQSLALLIGGAPARAASVARMALEHAQESQHPNTQGVAMCLAGALFQEICRDVAATKAYTASIRELAQNRSLGLWLMTARVFEYWVLGREGDCAGAIAGMRKTLDEHKASGTYLVRSHFLALLAELHLAAGRWEKGVAAIEEAFEVVRDTGELLWEAELYRLRGAFAATGNGPHGEAQEWLGKAIACARSQGARLWELRATYDLARLLREQGKQDEAASRLSAILAHFQDGAGIDDVRQAAKLRAEVARQ